MSQTTLTGSLNLGFLTIVYDAGGYLGGYLVTNFWGRPLEFRLSTAVQANRIQQILYGETLRPYICAELIGKTLIEKTTAEATILFTDQPVLLALRPHVTTAVAWITARLDTPLPAEATLVRSRSVVAPEIYQHARFPADADRIKEQVEKAAGSLNLLEPFERIKDAIAEARKMGVTNRAS